MVPVKIECGCGQNYAFDVEPVNGKMPGAVSCPSCGADGTVAANDYISQQFVPAVTAAGTVRAPMRLARAQAEATVPVAADDPERAKMVREAKAKMVGGESTEQVAAFLTVKGFNRTEAMELARSFYQERASIVRSNGVKKTFVGLLLMLAPFIAWYLSKASGHLRIRRFLWAYGVGIAGGYLFISGLIMILAPKSEQGTVVKE